MLKSLSANSQRAEEQEFRAQTLESRTAYVQILACNELVELKGYVPTSRGLTT